jgi:predicted TIM-barrel enzyme
LLGSGVTAANIGSFRPQADGFIVGSEFKRGGHWTGPVDPKRVERFMTALRAPAQAKKTPAR